MAKHVKLKADFTGGIPTVGVHVARVKSSEVKMNKSEDGQNLALVFEVTEGDSKGRTARMWQSLKDEQRGRYTLVLTTLGIEAPNGLFDFDPDDLVGAKCQLQISHEDFNGEPTARVNRVLPLGRKDDGSNDTAVEYVEDTEDAPATKLPARLKPKKVEEPDEELEDDEDEEEVKPKTKAKSRKADEDKDDGLPF